MKPTDERRTPRWLFDALDAEFSFYVDLAAVKDNTLTDRYFGPDHNLEAFRDSLQVPWYDVCGESTGWLNMPYSRGQILQWCAKAEAEAALGFTTVALLPGDTSTEYFHRYVLAGEHRVIKRRLSFEGAPRDKKGRLAPAKFGSVLRIFRPTHKLWTYR